MVFLISKDNNEDIFYTHDPKRAKNYVSMGLNEGISFGVYGAKNKDLFLLLYPEFKGRYFVSI